MAANLCFPRLKKKKENVLLYFVLREYISKLIYIFFSGILILDIS